jgi:phosphoribosylformylglycinamidine (FGAM) synthase-like amidotransferase family enzyme
MARYIHQVSVDVTVKMHARSLLVTEETELRALFLARRIMDRYVREGVGADMAKVLEAKINEKGFVTNVEYDGIGYELGEVVQMIPHSEG